MKYTKSHAPSATLSFSAKVRILGLWLSIGKLLKEEDSACGLKAKL
jgi:hypothetical protein